MATPTLDDFLASSARWRGEHHGITYELSWHGKSEYSPQGTWCWYIFVTSEQFYPDDWAKLRLEKQDRDMFGLYRRHWDYDRFPDIDAHGGWTFGEMTVYLGRDGAEYEQVEVGCDYAHLWDRERGFPEGRLEVERDVKHSIDLLVAMFPRRRPRCAYSGKYDDPEQFYLARNGSHVHRSYEQKLREENWHDWLPAEAAE